jgi:hypothetical protein
MSEKADLISKVQQLEAKQTALLEQKKMVESHLVIVRKRIAELEADVARMEAKESTVQEKSLNSTLTQLGSKGVARLCVGERDRPQYVRCAILDTGQRVYPPYGHELTYKMGQTRLSETQVPSCVVYRSQKQWSYLNEKYCRITSGECWGLNSNTIYLSEDQFCWLLLNKRAYSEVETPLTKPITNS